MPLHLTLTSWPLVTASSPPPKKPLEDPPKESPKGKHLGPSGASMKRLMWLCGVSSIVTCGMARFNTENEFSVRCLNGCVVVDIIGDSEKRRAVEIIENNH